MKREARRVSRFVSTQIWALKESTLDVIVEVLRMRAAGITLSKEEIQARIGAGSTPSATMRGSVAVLPLMGVISPKINAMTEISGGTSLDVWMKQFRAYRDDPDVSAIVLDVDSPGGSVFGVVEAADEMFKARAVKPIIAQVDPECGSAALWLALMASEVACTPSGAIGSLGCFCVHEDWSKANEMMGMKPTYIAYGEYKVEGNSDAPLSDEALVYVQSQVDTVGASFVASVAKGRGVGVAKVKTDYGQGRMLLAKDALAVGMVDRIATLDETIARMTGGAKRRSMVGATEVRPGVFVADRSTSAFATLAAKAEADVNAILADGPSPGGLKDLVPMIDAANDKAEKMSTSILDAAKSAKAETMEPNEDGECEDGYEMGDDGICHLMPMEDEESKAKALHVAEQAQADQDAVNVAVALSE